jgi:signal transduction histidine kinase
MATDLSADIAAVQSISAVPLILEVVCRSTGMGFAAVARVTDQRWVCCAMRDEIAFGLTPGGELEVETTLCHEIRQSHEAVVIDNVSSGEILGLMQKSVARMSALIDNALDFARGRLGSGIALKRPAQSLEPILDQVIAELRAVSPESKIETTFNLTQPVDCDGGRIAQLFSNLLGNSVTHGTATKPIRVSATTHGGEFVLAVANSGKPIPPEVMDRLFQPFYRVSAQDARQGLGLGLYIVSEIARAHDGTIEVTSSPEETEFTFRMPLR